MSENFADLIAELSSAISTVMDGMSEVDGRVAFIAGLFVAWAVIMLVIRYLGKLLRIGIGIIIVTFIVGGGYIGLGELDWLSELANKAGVSEVFERIGDAQDGQGETSED